jgi:hypothetical protein
VLDVKGFNAATTTATTGAGSFDDATGLTTLTVTDSSDHQTTTFELAGDLSGSSWTVSDDGKGGADIVDPPAASTDSHGSNGFMPSDEQITFGPNGEVTYTIDSGTTLSNATPNLTTTVVNGNGTVVGDANNDTFVFQPGMGAETIANFNLQHDTLSFEHFSDVQTVQQLQSLITADAHGDAAINLGHSDSVTLAGVTTAQLQQAIQSGHVLLH